MDFIQQRVAEKTIDIAFRHLIFKKMTKGNQLIIDLFFQ